MSGRGRGRGRGRGTGRGNGRGRGALVYEYASPVVTSRAAVVSPTRGRGRGGVAVGSRKVVMASGPKQRERGNGGAAAAIKPPTLNERFGLLAQRRLEAADRQSANRMDTLMARRTGMS